MPFLLVQIQDENTVCIQICPSLQEAAEAARLYILSREDLEDQPFDFSSAFVTLRPADKLLEDLVVNLPKGWVHAYAVYAINDDVVEDTLDFELCVLEV